MDVLPKMVRQIVSSPMPVGLIIAYLTAGLGRGKFYGVRGWLG